MNADSNTNTDNSNTAAEVRTKLEKLHGVVFGNGSAGLDERVAGLENAVYKNRHTGQHGLIERVSALEARLNTMLTLLKGIAVGVGINMLDELPQVIGWLGKVLGW